MALNANWQSPIAPGLTWYQGEQAERPAYPSFNGRETADVAIIGGGYTGLQAAYHLARAGMRVILLEAARVGDGASGRNGGQLGTGQRLWPEEIEPKYGLEKTRALLDLAERAKSYLFDFARTQSIEIDYKPGHMNVGHHPRYRKDYERHAELAASRYGYEQIRFMDRQETQERVGSSRYLFGVYDSGTGHIDPLKLVLGLARAAEMAGAQIHELSPARSIRRAGRRNVIKVKDGEVETEHVLIACNGYIKSLEPVTESHVMPIRSFIGATEPLDRFPRILPGHESVADSRFVVRYFRKSPDGRLLFGGREAYTADNPANLGALIKRQIEEIYPELKTTTITHAWGGTVGITLSRLPFVRELGQGVMSIGGFSGHGILLANYFGKLYADTLCGGSSDLDLIRSLDISPFPGGRHFRKTLLLLALSWYSILDRL